MESDQTGRLDQRIAQRNLVTNFRSLIDVCFDDAQGLIRETLDPENACEGGARHHALVELEANDVRPIRRWLIPAQHAFDMEPGRGLLSKDVKANDRSSDQQRSSLRHRRPVAATRANSSASASAERFSPRFILSIHRPHRDLS